MCLHPTTYLQMYAYCNCTRDEYNGRTARDTDHVACGLPARTQGFAMDHQTLDDARVKGG